MIKNILKRQTLIITITVITLCIGLLGVSYAIFFSVNDGEEQKVTSGDLVIQFQDKTEIITTATEPQTDDEGENNKYTFSVTNVGSLPMKYNIYLYDDPNANKNGTQMIPHAYLKVKLDNGTITTLKALEDKVGNTISDNNITKIKINSKELSVSAKSTDNEEATNVKTHNISIWIDEEAPESIIGNTVALQLEVFGEVGETIPPKSFDKVIVADNKTIFADEAGNLRYVGATPNNYIWFNCDDYTQVTDENTAKTQNCEKWRIIGLFNNIEKADGNKENLVKIVRDESIGNYSWDNKDTTTGADDNSGKSDWTTAELMYLLNPNNSEHKLNGVTANNSLYWNSGNGNCSNGQYNATTTCDFRSTGLKGNDSGPTKSMIENVKWNLGGITGYFYADAQEFYSAERGEDTYNKRQTTWNGKVGLIYPSDYGYATAGGTKKTRQECLNYQLHSWESGEYQTDCAGNDWLKPSSGYLWTLTPYSLVNGGSLAVSSKGYPSSNTSYCAYVVRPSLYLTSNVGIKEGVGTGDATHPYILEVME